MICSGIKFLHLAISKRVFKGVILFSLLSACAKTESSSDSVSEFRELAITKSRAVADILSDNQAIVEFELPGDTTAIQLIAESSGRKLAFVSLRGPGERALFDAENAFDRSSTNADSFHRDLSVFNFPIIGQNNLDPLKGGIYQAQLATQTLSKEEYSGKVSSTVSLTILAKNDSDITIGTIPIKIFQSRSLAASREAREGFEDALNVSREILARAGLSLATSIEVDAAVPENLPSPAEGDPLFQRESLGDGGYIPLYVASTASALRSPLNPIAQAGNVPGPLIPTVRSGIVVSISAAGGSDRIIDSQEDRDDPSHTSEVRLLGEAMAHEILHYLGLQDSMAFTGGSVSESDVTDSPKCISLEECRVDPDAPQNIMFPFALDRERIETDKADKQDENIPRQFLSTLQTITAQLAIGTE